MLIKAGTYKFKPPFDIAPLPQNTQNTFAFDFNTSMTIGTDTATILCDNIMIYKDYETLFFTFNIVGWLFNGERVEDEEEMLGSMPIYSASNGWLYSEGTKNLGETITTDKDQEVDDAFGSWFKAHTQPLNTETVKVENVIAITHDGYRFNLNEIYDASIGTLNYIVVDTTPTDNILITDTTTTNAYYICDLNCLGTYDGNKWTNNTVILIESEDKAVDIGSDVVYVVVTYTNGEEDTPASVFGLRKFNETVESNGNDYRVGELLQNTELREQIWNSSFIEITPISREIDGESVILEGFTAFFTSSDSAYPDMPCTLCKIKYTEQYIERSVLIPVHFINLFEDDFMPSLLGGFNVTATANGIVDEWLLANTKAVEITKKFTRLYLGEVAYSSNGKRFRKLQDTEYVEPSEPEETLEAGLYDADDNLVASWDTLVNTYGMDCGVEYEPYDDNPSRPKNVLTDNGELAEGKKLIIDDSVTRVGANAFRDCTHLTSITIGESVKYIAQYAFQDCDNLTSVKMGNSVVGIGSLAFGNCTLLSNVTLSNSLESLYFGAFQDCRMLKEIVIPDSVTEIEREVFYWSGLTKVTIGKSVTLIKSYAFASSPINTIIFNGTVAQWNTITLEDGWNKYTPVTYVQCTDGQVTL